MKQTWTVGLIHKDSVKTHMYDSFAEAKKEFEEWKKYFKMNNSINHSVTIIGRNEIDTITSIIVNFYLDDYIDIPQMFLCKND